MRELVVTVILFHILEPLEVECKDLWETLHSQSLCGLLFAVQLPSLVAVRGMSSLQPKKTTNARS